MLIPGLPELHLVGGSGPHEGNILVGGRPVCDDGHNAQNALVVCRFPFYLGAMISNKPLKIMMTSKNSKGAGAFHSAGQSKEGSVGFGTFQHPIFMKLLPDHLWH